MPKAICSNELLEDARRAIAGAKRSQQDPVPKDQSQNGNIAAKQKPKARH
jgi:hypothetical protein